MKILNIGSINIDNVYSLDTIVRPGETATSYKFETFPGGKGLNQSIAAARAGAEIFHAGCVGYDGNEMLDVLSKNGVDISYVKKVNQRNGHAVIQVEASGQNSIIVSPGANEAVSKEYIDSVLENFGSGDIILLQNEISNVDYIVERAYQIGMYIIFNPSPFDDEIKKIDFNKLSYLILNEVEAKEISGNNIPDAGLNRIRKEYPDLKVLLTLGDKGCIYSDGDMEIYQSAFEVETVDTTAAGDTFTGYFTVGIASGMAYEEILKIASAASALAVSKNGAVPSIPCRDEVMRTIETLKEKKSIRHNDMLKEQIRDYIEKNISSASLEELSAVLGYSAVYTGRLVKQFTGQSFAKLIQNKRCEFVAEKLSETDLTIDEIIKDAGYENVGFFRKIFKEKYGVNPMEYRKKR